MDAELLLKCCEAAGLEVRDKAISPGWEAGKHEPGCVWWWDDDDPALPAYVASLLVEKVRELPHESWSNYYQRINIMQNKETPYVPDYLATDEQRIRAALEVLEIRSGHNQ